MTSALMFALKRRGTSLLFRAAPLFWKWQILWTVGLTALLLILIGVFASVSLGDAKEWFDFAWKWLRPDQGPHESRSTTIRNIGLVAAGAIAIAVAVWRSVVAERQSRTEIRQLQNERYQKGAEMLGSEDLSVRLGGIYALQQLAVERPQAYHVDVLRLLSTFVRERLKSTGEAVPGPRLPQDVRASVLALGRKTWRQRVIEFRTDGSIVDLREVDLSGADFQGLELTKAQMQDAVLSDVDLSYAVLDGADLEGTDLRGSVLLGAQMRNAILFEARLNRANLTDANLQGAQLQEAILIRANLTSARLRKALLWRARLWGADVTGADLEGADLSGTLFASEAAEVIATGLRQQQLDKAVADFDNPPRVDGVSDALSGQELHWSRFEVAPGFWGRLTSKASQVVPLASLASPRARARNIIARVRSELETSRRS